MKNNIAVFVLTLAVTLGIFALPATAGDDAVSQITGSADAGVPAICSSVLRPKTRYAIQPNVDVYVRVSPAATGYDATSANVKVVAGTLYDTPTTSTQNYICVKPVTAAASNTVQIFQYRGPQE